jgi:hypothetical protein
MNASCGMLTDPYYHQAHSSVGCCRSFDYQLKVCGSTDPCC